MTRITTATGSGTADYVFANDRPPAYLIAITPGAPEALAAWEEANAEGRAIYATQKRPASLALTEARNLANSHRISPDDLARAEAVNAEADRALYAAAQHAKSKAMAFDVLFTSRDPESREARLAAVAAYADEKHAEVIALWPQFRAALEAREEAYIAAGRPGWHAHHWSRSQIMGGQERPALDALENIVNKFPDVAATMASEPAAAAEAKGEVA